VLVARASFLVAVLVVVILALMPQLPPTPGIGGDKADHFAAFLVLAVLGVIGWRRQSVVLALGLLGLGAILEALQGTAFIHRDADMLDWLADAAGVVVGLTCMSPGLDQRLQPKRCQRDRVKGSW
jgi:VanZ family protein